jgi:hypothetical protein
MRDRSKLFLIPCAFAVSLGCANPAAGDSIISPSGQDVSVIDDGAEDVPPVDITGWFLTFDPSNEWTSAANIVTMEEWLAVAEEIADNSTSTEVIPVTPLDSSVQTAVPEPVTLGLLALALAVLTIYVPLRRFD